MEIFVIMIIAVSLSMDAFSLSLAYGTVNLDKNSRLKLSIIVGLYHFFMPLLGNLIGAKVFHIIPIEPKIIVFMILSFIGVQMIIESFKETKTEKLMSLSQLLLFGFAVSVDSLSVGIGLNAINKKTYLCAFIFSICSFIFTYLGLILGNKLNKLLGKLSTIIGGLVLIIIGFIYLFN